MMAAISIMAPQQADRKQLESAIMATWADYCKADDARTSRGVEFGRACYELREQTKAQGSRTGDGFTDALHRLNIPKSTAYKWIGRHEVAAGISLCPPVDEVDDAAPAPPAIPTTGEPLVGRNKQRAESNKDRLISTLGRMRIDCHGVTGGIKDEVFSPLDLTRALSAMNAEDRQFCIDTALEVSKALREFAKSLEGRS